jgi:hypothetical protein
VVSVMDDTEQATGTLDAFLEVVVAPGENGAR